MSSEMMTTISLGNIHGLTYIPTPKGKKKKKSKKTTNFFFFFFFFLVVLVMKTLPGDLFDCPSRARHALLASSGRGQGPC